jgi:hypothetical protein
MLYQMLTQNLELRTFERPKGIELLNGEAIEPA